MVKIERVYGTAVVEEDPTKKKKKKKSARTRYVAPQQVLEATSLIPHGTQPYRGDANGGATKSHLSSVKVYQCQGSTVPQSLVREVFALSCAGPTVANVPKLAHVVSQPPQENDYESLQGGNVALVMERAHGVSVNECHGISSKMPGNARRSPRLQTPCPLLQDSSSLLLSASKQLLELAAGLLERAGIHHRGWRPENIQLDFMPAPVSDDDADAEVVLSPPSVQVSLVDFGNTCSKWAPLTGAHSEGFAGLFPLHYHPPELLFQCAAPPTEAAPPAKPGAELDDPYAEFEEAEEEGEESEESVCELSGGISTSESWTLGCLLYFMATGQELFVAGSAQPGGIGIEVEDDPTVSVLLRWIEEFGSQPLRSVGSFSSSPVFRDLMATDAVEDALVLAVPSHNLSADGIGQGFGPCLELLSLRSEAVASAIGDLLTVDPAHRPTVDEVLFRHFSLAAAPVPAFPSSLFSMGYGEEAAQCRKDEHDAVEDEQCELSVPFSLVETLHRETRKQLLVHVVSDLVAFTRSTGSGTKGETSFALSPNAVLLGCDIFALVQQGATEPVLSVVMRSTGDDQEDEDDIYVSLLLGCVLLGVKILEDAYDDDEHGEALARSLITAMTSGEVSVGPTSGGFKIPLSSLLDVAMLKSAEMRILSVVPDLLGAASTTTGAASEDVLPTFLNGNSLAKLANNKKLFSFTQSQRLDVVREMVLLRVGIEEVVGDLKQCSKINSYKGAEQQCIQKLLS